MTIALLSIFAALAVIGLVVFWPYESEDEWDARKAKEAAEAWARWTAHAEQTRLAREEREAQKLLQSKEVARWAFEQLKRNGMTLEDVANMAKEDEQPR